MKIWLVMITAGLITFGLRVVFIGLLGRFAAPPLLERALRFAPPAVLMAIVFPELFLQDGVLAVSWQNPRLLAGLLAGLIAWRTRNALLTITLGMIALWVLQVLVG